MHRLLIGAVVLLAAPAHAIDYLQCEAIERAYVRTELEMKQSISLAKSAAEEISNPDACGQRPILTDPDYSRAKLAKYLECEEQADAPRVIKVVSDVQKTYMARLKKIKGDGLKAKCPAF